MRHLWSLLAGVVAAPLTWVLVSMGQGGSTRTVTGWLESSRYDTVDLIEPAAYLAAAGIVLGLIGTLRFSPLGPLVAGLLLIGPYAGMFVDPFAVRDAVPGGWELFGDTLPLRLPLDNGTLLLVGVLLVMATFSAQRWRRWPAEAAAVTAPLSPTEPAADAEAAVPDSSSEPSLDTPEPSSPAASADRDGEPAPADAPAVGAQTAPDTPWSAPPSAAGKRTGTAES